MSQRWPTCLGLLVMMACQGSTDSGSVDLATEVVDEAPEVVISTQSGVIGLTSDLLVGSKGKIYLSDGQAHRIHVVDDRGDVSGFVGGEGSGPDELLRPGRMRLLGDTLAVVDNGNGRLQLFDTAGSALGSRPLPPGPPSSIGPRGRFLQPVFGADSALAVLHSSNLENRISLGMRLGPAIEIVRLGSMKDAIEEGEIPAIFLNTAEGVIDREGATWLYVPATGAVTKYDGRGREQWSTTIEDASFPDVRLDFVARNRTIGHDRVWPLRYILDARVVDRRLWILLGQSIFSPSTILMLGQNGDVEGRVSFPNVVGATQFAADPIAGQVYFVLRESAQLVRVPYRFAG